MSFPIHGVNKVGALGHSFSFVRVLRVISIFWSVLLLASAFSARSAFAVSGDFFDYHGYWRAGSGSNVNGNDMQCHSLNGVPGNEFRLGNECGVYGENYFQAYTPEAKSANGQFFRANFDFSFNPAGKNLNELPNFNVFGTYIEAAHLDGGPETFWVGKRYYRDTDIHIDDFFYFADTSGDGAGVEGIPLAGGTFAFAYLREDASDADTQGDASPRNQAQRGITLFDARLFQVPLADKHQLNFWAGFAVASGGTNPVDNVTYNSATGIVAGVKEQYKVDAGYNRFTVIYGRGLMQGMNLSGAFGADPTQILGQPYANSAHRFRIVEECVFQNSRHFATAIAAIYETWQIQPNFDYGRWASLGARPIYFFNEHYSLAFEAGAANAKMSGPSGSNPNTPLVRVTLAPQISPAADFFSRPVLRAFITDTLSVQDGMNYGVQGEVWF